MKLKLILTSIVTASVLALLFALPAGANQDGPGTCTDGYGYGYGYGYGCDTRPGWGYGDDNHEHSGPPGPKDDQGVRPGWGHGDDNHEHSGPPGHDAGDQQAPPASDNQIASGAPADGSGDSDDGKGKGKKSSIPWDNPGLHKGWAKK